MICILKLSYQATVLEEMPPFAERESSILAKLKKKAPDGAVAQTGFLFILVI